MADNDADDITEIEGDVLPGDDEFEPKAGDEDDEDGEGDDDDDDESESSPDDGEDGEGTPQAKKVAFTPEQQEVFNRVIGEKTHKQREAERRAEQLAEELATVRASLPREQEPLVPPMPDPYDDQYEAKVGQRDQAILALAQFRMRQQYAQQQQYDLERQQERAQLEVVAGIIRSYADQAKKLGIRAEALQVAGAAVNSIGIDPEVAQDILEDTHGPLITLYLAKNLLHVERMKGMRPTKAAHYIETVVKPRATAARVKQPSAPKPVKALGRGGAPRRERGPKGAHYE